MSFMFLCCSLSAVSEAFPTYMEAWSTSIAAMRPPSTSALSLSTQTYQHSNIPAFCLTRYHIYTYVSCITFGMSEPHYGQKWRGLPWSQWENIVKTPTIANLRVLIERYNQTAKLVFPQNLVKQQMVELAMVTLDKHAPRLDNKQVRDVFSFSLQGNAVKPSRQNPHFNNNRQGLVSIPKTPIISDQLRLTCISEAQTANRRFLQAVYRQSWQLLDIYLPYIPAQPLSGGRIVDSNAALQSLLLGHSPDPGISWLQLDFNSSPIGDEQYAFSTSGKIFPCRGRGPIWKENSCALDCAIVAARLLNLGRTVADKGEKTHEDWSAALRPLVTHFINVVSQPWEGLDDTESWDHRQKFLTRFLRDFNGSNKNPTQFGEFLPVTAVWGLSTSGMMQFSFSFCTRSVCSQCKERTETSLSTFQVITLSEIKNAAKKKRPTMTALLNSFFSGEKRKCEDCKSPKTRTRWKAVHGSLPSRLAILPAQSYRDVARATSQSIEIKYVDTKATPNTATYRWLGGIYQSAGHYRLYWNDCGPSAENPNKDSGPLMVYDGMKLEGSIVGGLIAKVPSKWSKGADILFYERVEPSATTLQYAAESIKQGVDDALQQQLQPSQPAQSNQVHLSNTYEAPQQVKKTNKRKRKSNSPTESK